MHICIADTPPYHYLISKRYVQYKSTCYPNRWPMSNNLIDMKGKELKGKLFKVLRMTNQEFASHFQIAKGIVCLQKSFQGKKTLLFWHKPKKTPELWCFITQGGRDSNLWRWNCWLLCSLPSGQTWMEGCVASWTRQVQERINGIY